MMLSLTSTFSISRCRTSLSHRAFFFFTVPATTEIYTLSLHDALPILARLSVDRLTPATVWPFREFNLFCSSAYRSEEHTYELQSHHDLVCRLLLEKKKKNKYTIAFYIINPPFTCQTAISI